MSERISAPGKVFLAGEYAVLDGHPALVAGIDRWMHASVDRIVRIVRFVHRPSGVSWEPPAPPPQQLRFAARAATLAGAQDLDLVFEDDFSVEGVKIGLGGSAAACVLTVRAARPQASDEEVLAIAAAAHWAEQGGQGSGADVAACALGGVLEVRSHIPWRSPEEVMALPPAQIRPSLSVRRVAVPADLRLLIAFTGKPADTRALIGSVRREPAGMEAIASACRQLIAALEVADRKSALEAVRAGAQAMKDLGVVTHELARVSALADEAGAAAKPSGAGGGDCAVVFAFGDETAARVEAALRAHFPVFRVSPA